MATQDFSRSLPMMLYRALDAVMPRFRRIFNEFGLTEQQWRVLRVLWEHEDIAVRELAETTLIPAPSLVGIVDRLAKQGLVARERSQADRRNVFVRATEPGKELHRRVKPHVDEAYAELRASIDADAWQQLMTGLEQVAMLEFAAPEQRSAVNQ
jgi:homoprotocatechuate degradation regulator HpaR